MRQKHLAGLIFALFSATSAHAFTPFVVKDIRVEGLQRTEAGTVFNYLPVKVGDTFTDDGAAAAIKALYATGFFKDVRLEVDGNVLVVVIDEQPAIGVIEFEGNKDFDTETLRKGLRDAGIVESRVLDRALLDRAEQEIKRQYLNKSFYAATVQTVITPLERNRVGVKFRIYEGEAAAIQQVSIAGNKVFSEKELKNQIIARPRHWFPPVNWFSSDHEYSKQKLQGDLESIRSYYLNRGYLDFAVENSQVSITPDKKDIYIAIGLAEGEQYRVANVKVAGDLIISDEEIKSLVLIKPGEIFSREKLTETTRAISDRLGNEGYAFANVNAAPELNKEKREVSFTIYVDPGRRVYVRRINIVGNTRTRDEVVRRELRQFENAWYDGARIKRSKARVDRLGYFEDSNFETTPVPGTADQVDLTLSVKERPTGSFTFGVGYSSSDGVILQASLSQNNVFGSGNALSLNVNTGRSQRTAVIGYTNPFFTPEGVSLGYDLYYKTYNPSETTSVSHYKTQSSGLGVRLGYPIAEDDRINVGLSFDSTRTTVYDDSPSSYKAFVSEFGDRTNTVLGTLSWDYDSRDSYMAPVKGVYQRIGGEVALPVAEQRFWRANYLFQWYIPVVFKDDTLLLQTNLGYAKGYGGRPVPFYKNYYAGGIGSLRGFKDNSLGERDEYGNALGGTQLISYGLEYFVPVPVAKPDKTFRMSVFVDAANVWQADEPIAVGDIRYSTGFAVAWLSPVGPLKFSVGYPIKKLEGDRTEKFQFQLGNIY